MGSITLNKNNRLYWLGRYSERVYRGIVIVRNTQDEALDGEVAELDAICAKLGIANIYTSIDDFCSRYCFDRGTNISLISTADSMLGNGMVLRELLGSPTLSYLQMAVSAIELASTSKSPGVQLQWVLDDIMAFRGSYSEFVSSEKIRNTIKTGASVERVSTMIRFDEELVVLRNEVQKLLCRMEKTTLHYIEENLTYIKEFAFSEEDIWDKVKLLNSIESLFLI